MKFCYSLKLMSAKFFSESRPLSGDCGAVSPNLISRHPNLTRALLLLLVLGLAAGCTQKRGVTENPDKQFYQEAPQHYLPFPAVPLKGAMFLKADRNLGSDLVWFSSAPEKGARIWILLNRGRQGFDYSNSRGRTQEFEREILFLTAGDLDEDRSDDLLLITPPTEAGSAKILFNNGKGHFFSREKYSLPFVRRGINRVDLVDLDHDRDIDLIFTGAEVLRADGQLDKWQGQVLISNGKGEFKDETELLWPQLPPGIAGTSIADYDGDSFPDVFLVYGNGQNRLLINNGVGRFADHTRRLLPLIQDQSTHADWADFDRDGDNDLLVINRAIKKRYRAHSRETCYFLENDGRGRFRKKPHAQLPSEPAHRVYLLDANGTGVPDAIILSETGPRFLIGHGNWKFSVDTDKRMPASGRLEEMTFGDVNGDGFLDLLGFTDGLRKPRLWLNQIN